MLLGLVSFFSFFPYPLFLCRCRLRIKTTGRATASSLSWCAGFSFCLLPLMRGLIDLPVVASSEKILFSRVVNLACIRTKLVFNRFDSLWSFITFHSFSKNRSDSFTQLIVFAAMQLFLDENQNSNATFLRWESKPCLYFYHLNEANVF